MKRNTLVKQSMETEAFHLPLTCSPIDFEVIWIVNESRENNFFKKKTKFLSDVSMATVKRVP